MRRALEIAVIVAAILVASVPFPRNAIERVYSRGIYPSIQPVLTRLSNRTAMPLFDLTLLALIVAIIVLWTVGLTRSPQNAKWLVRGRLILHTFAIMAIVYLWFLFTWGFNYQREPLRTMVDFQEDRITPTALRDLAVRTVEELNALYGPAHTSSGSPEPAWIEAWGNFAQSAAALDAPFAEAQRELGMAWRVTPAEPKRSLLDGYFRRVSVDGMTDPFFLETLTNQSILPFERPFVIAHEWAHLAGYADESEANFLAWLTCMRGSPQQRYSAWLSLYGTIVSALPPEDRAAVVRRLEPGPRRDLAAMADRVARQVNPAARRAGSAVYDRFLKANRVPAGIRSYSEVLRLMLGTRFNADGSPVLRNQ